MMGGARPDLGMVKRILRAIPPASGAEVMGAGIVSIALSLAGQETLSRILLVIDPLTWIVLVMLLPTRVWRDRARFRADARTPAALTAVAGTAVLGTRLTILGWDWAGAALLVISLMVWAALLVPVLGNRKTPTLGVSLLLAVSTESLAALAAALAAHEHSRWLLIAALMPFGVGLACYIFVLAQFDFHQLLVGRGDQWITGGGLAIATLAAAQLTTGAESLRILRDSHETFERLTLGLWVLTMLWLPVLVLTEALRPRFGYNIRRWSTVFPVGMYAACSFAASAVTRANAPASFAPVWVWVALTVWTITSVAALQRGQQMVCTT